MKLVLILSVLALAGGAAAQQPAVEVHFQVVDPSYQRRLGPALPQAEQSATEVFATFLRERFPVYDWKTDSGPAYRLEIELGPKGDSTGSPTADRGFNARVVGPDSTTTRSWIGLFQRGSTLDEGFGAAGIPVQDAFLMKLRTELASLDLEKLLRYHLSSVPVTQTARIYRPEFGWVADLNEAGPCVVEPSPARVLVLLPNPVLNKPARRLFDARVDGGFNVNGAFPNGVPADYASLKGPMFTSPNPPDQPDLDKVKQNTAASVAAVYLLSMPKSAASCRAAVATPDSAESNPGGQP